MVGRSDETMCVTIRVQTIAIILVVSAKSNQRLNRPQAAGPIASLKTRRWEMMKVYFMSTILEKFFFRFDPGTYPMESSVWARAATLACVEPTFW